MQIYLLVVVFILTIQHSLGMVLIFIVVAVENSMIANNTANTNISNITGGAGEGIGTGQNNRIALTNSIVTGNLDGRDNTPSDISGFF